MKITRQNLPIAIAAAHAFIALSQVIIEALRLYFDYF